MPDIILKPCPFCGAAAKLYSYTTPAPIDIVRKYYACCTACGAERSVRFASTDAAIAAEHWNQRADGGDA